jgi:hypothetical protein
MNGKWCEIESHILQMTLLDRMIVRMVWQEFVMYVRGFPCPERSEVYHWGVLASANQVHDTGMSGKKKVMRKNNDQRLVLGNWFRETHTIKGKRLTCAFKSDSPAHSGFYTISWLICAHTHIYIFIYIYTHTLWLICAHRGVVGWGWGLGRGANTLMFTCTGHVRE